MDALAAEIETEQVGDLELTEAAGQVPQNEIRKSRPALRSAIEEARALYRARLE